MARSAGHACDDAQGSEATAALCVSPRHNDAPARHKCRESGACATGEAMREAGDSGALQIRDARSTTFANARAKQKRTCTRSDPVPPPSECGEKVEGRDMTPLPRK